MRILLTTLAGPIAPRVLRELLAPEFSVRVIASKPKHLRSDVLRQVEVVHGSAEDVSTLRSALDGVEALFWCLPAEVICEPDLRGYYERFARELGAKQSAKPTRHAW